MIDHLGPSQKSILQFEQILNFIVLYIRLNLLLIINNISSEKEKHEAILDRAKKEAAKEAAERQAAARKAAKEVEAQRRREEAAARKAAKEEEAQRRREEAAARKAAKESGGVRRQRKPRPKQSGIKKLWGGRQWSLMMIQMTRSYSRRQPRGRCRNTDVSSRSARRRRQRRRDRANLSQHGSVVTAVPQRHPLQNHQNKVNNHMQLGLKYILKISI
jgi:hypothetical protein